MTLKHRIIPILLTDGQGNCVKPIRFQRPYRKVGSLMQYIKMFEKRNVDELIVLDIEATKEGRLIDCDKIKEYTKELFCPLTLGGGINSLDDVNKLLQSGADKVAIKTNNLIISDASRKFGSQAIVAIMDVTSLDLPHHVAEYAMVIEQDGAGEILLTYIDYDGSMAGYHVTLINYVSHLVNIPIIASGGCSEPADMAKAIKAGASAVAAGSMFLFKDITPKDCAEYLHKEGIEVRL